MILNKKFTLLLFILSLCCASTNAYNVPQTQDTAKTHILDEMITRNIFQSEYEINESEFIKRYAFDSHSKQIINTNFSKTRLAFFFFVLPIFPLLILLFGGFLVIAGSPEGEAIMQFGFVSYVIAWLLRIFGIYLLINSNKKKLLLKLIEHRKQYNLTNKKND